MTLDTLVLAQETADTSSAAALVFGTLVLVAVLSVFGLTKRGRRSLLPIVSMLIGISIAYTTATQSQLKSFAPFWVIGFFFAILLIVGGFGALREGVRIPDVEGVEPSITPQAPRITPDDTAS